MISLLFLPVASAIVITATVIHFGWEKLVCWELYAAEQFTWIVGSSNTFLLRNTEIVCRNEHLHIADNLNDCEKTDSRKHDTVWIAGFKFAAKVFANAVRNPAAYVANMRRTVANAGGKTNWLGYLAGSFWQNSCR